MSNDILRIALALLQRPHVTTI